MHHHFCALQVGGGARRLCPVTGRAPPRPDSDLVYLRSSVSPQVALLTWSLPHQRPPRALHILRTRVKVRGLGRRQRAAPRLGRTCAFSCGATRRRRRKSRGQPPPCHRKTPQASRTLARGTAKSASDRPRATTAGLQPEPFCGDLNHRNIFSSQPLSLPSESTTAFACSARACPSPQDSAGPDRLRATAAGHRCAPRRRR